MSDEHNDRTVTFTTARRTVTETDIVTFVNTVGLCEPFFLDMPRYFQKSDIVISRAGATTIAELIASQKASMLVPFSKATDNHQVLNARELERIKATEVILEEDFNPELLASRIMGFVDEREKIQTMEKNLESLKPEHVAEKIASLCLNLMESKHKE